MASVNTFGLMFTPELAKGSLVLALISAAVIVGLFAYVGRRTQRAAYNSWAIGWLFYTVFLAAQIAAGSVAQDSQLVVIPLMCVALAAWFMFCGNLQWLDRPARRPVPRLGEPFDDDVSIPAPPLCSGPAP